MDILYLYTNNDNGMKVFSIFSGAHENTSIHFDKAYGYIDKDSDIDMIIPPVSQSFF